MEYPLLAEALRQALTRYDSPRVTIEGGGAAPVFIEIAEPRGAFWVLGNETDDGSWQLDHYADEATRVEWEPDGSVPVGVTDDPGTLAGWVAFRMGEFETTRARLRLERERALHGASDAMRGPKRAIDD